MAHLVLMEVMRLLHDGNEIEVDGEQNEERVR